MGEPTPLWLDCDPGHDDAFAILLATHHPSLRLIGLSTVHGNASLQSTTQNAGSVLTALGHPDVHVYPGARKPLCRDAVHAPDIHGDTGLDGTSLLPPPLSPPITDVPAIIAMREAILSERAGTVWIVATGALTNVAILFAAFPDLITRIKGLSIMGGAVGASYTQAPMGKVNSKVRIGNITPYAEFNIYCDPEAARAIFGTPELAAKTWLVPLDVSHLVLATPDIQRKLLFADDTAEKAGQPSRLRQMLYDLLLFFASTYDRVFGISAGPPLHDPLAVAILLDPENQRFSYRADQCSGGERWQVTVVTDGEHETRHRKGHGGTLGNEAELNMPGRTLLSRLEPGTPETESRGVRVPRGVDGQWFWGEILAAVERAETHTQSRDL